MLNTFGYCPKFFFLPLGHLNPIPFYKHLKRVEGIESEWKLRIQKIIENN